ncbi:MAG: hypothetical protein HOP18_22370 [Deltaproteobacteria bacterium]|nr:hypothetical protein [Deltaproteobacteria bacterium]
MMYLFHEFTLDEQRYQLRRAGEIVEVEPKVFDLLAHLIRHRERSVSRDELIEHLWQGTVVSEAALTQCVAKARKAVGDGGGTQQFIKTQHGRGYRFVGTVVEHAEAPLPAAEQIVITHDPPTLLDQPGLQETQETKAPPSAPSFSLPRVDVAPWLRSLPTFPYPRATLVLLVLCCGVLAIFSAAPSIPISSSDTQERQSHHGASDTTFVERDRRGEWLLAANKPEAAAYYLRGWDYYSRFTPEANAQARQMFARAVAIDPQYATAYVSLGWTYLLEWSSLWTQETHSLDQALAMSQRALTLNQALPYAHALFSSVSLHRKEYTLALVAAEHAIALDPACADCFAILADILTATGQARKAIEMIEHARHLDPSSAASYAAILGRAYYLIGQPGLAAETLRRAVIRNPNALIPRLNLALAYSEIGRMERAQAEITAVLQLHPSLTLQALRERLPHQNLGQAEYLLASLHKVGLR